tara:strand:- start:1158 stop:1445 length:288 start_codon:yes stop_codon:yes gene_type:complete
MNKHNKKDWKEMTYITVLDDDKGVVFRYDTINCNYIRNMGTSINAENYDTAFVFNPDKESIEDFLTRMQHNVSSCQWMFHNHSEISSFTRKVFWS